MLAWKEYNDPTVSKYQFHLEQLRDEFAMYKAALRWDIDDNGNVNVQPADEEAAIQYIKKGFASWSLKWFQTALKASKDKMDVILKQSVNSQNKQVWNLFGVWDKYQLDTQKETKTVSKTVSKIVSDWENMLWLNSTPTTKMSSTQQSIAKIWLSNLIPSYN